MYTKKVLDHFQNPHNFGALKKPDGIGKVGNIRCGDVMWLYIKVSKPAKFIPQTPLSKFKIKDIKFKTFGCVAAIATSSMITDLVKGKSLEFALNIKKEDIIRGLGDLPPIKVHCSILATEGLTEATYDFLSKENLAIPKSLQKEHERLQRQQCIFEEKILKRKK